MELRITKHNVTAFPIYMSLFRDYPKIKEIHLWSRWVHGYFGSSYESYAEINGVRLHRGRFDDFIYANKQWKEIIEFLNQFK